MYGLLQCLSVGSRSFDVTGVELDSSRGCTGTVLARCGGGGMCGLNGWYVVVFWMVVLGLLGSTNLLLYAHRISLFVASFFVFVSPPTPKQPKNDRKQPETTLQTT